MTLVTAWLAGMAGGVHCAGMCGGIVSTLCAPPPGSAGGRRFAFLLAYNSGRIASYTAAGALAGALGQAGLLTRAAPVLQPVMFALASFMLLALGLHLSGAAQLVQRLEPAGARLWRAVQPWTRRVLPATTLSRALALGGLWGWLPCGLVYAALLAALGMGTWWQGALVLLAFGLGTLPNLLGLGWFSHRLRGLGGTARRAAGVVVAAFGVFGLVRVMHPVAVAGYGALCHVMPGLSDLF